MTKTWKEELPVVLTKDELLERGEALAIQDHLWEKTDTLRKRAVDGYKAELADIEGETCRLARIVREHCEPRPVDVREVRDFKENRVDIVRVDTGEVVRTRVMTDAERQIELLPRAELTLGDTVITREDAEAITRMASA